MKGRGPHPFVVVEGVNGAGKSTVADHLAQRLDATAFHYPPGWTAFRDAMRLDEDVPTVPRLAYYLGGIVQLASLQRDASRTAPVVADRYVASGLAAVACLGDLDEDALCRLAGGFLDHVDAPDVTLVLTVDPAVGAARIAARAAETGTITHLSERIAADPALARAFAEVVDRQVRRAGGDVVTLDTSGLDRPAMCAAASALVEDAIDRRPA